MICYRKDLRRQIDVAEYRLDEISAQRAENYCVLTKKQNARLIDKAIRYNKFIRACKLAMGGYGNAGLRL